VIVADRAAVFPIGATATLTELEADPHPLLHRLRSDEPVSWLPVLDGWLVTRRDLVLQAMRDSDTFTVDDTRFSTAQVVGPSMLSLDGREHARHRDPFARPFRLGAVRARFTEIVELEVDRLLDAVEPAGRADLRRDLAGPLSVNAMVHALGLEHTDPQTALGWYAAIVHAVTEITAGRAPGREGADAFAALRSSLEPALDRDPETSLVAAVAGDAGTLTRAEVASNAAVLLFGGIETTEATIANTLLHLLSNPAERALVEAEPELVAHAVEESLRLEPAAAVIDRYATRDVELGGAEIRERELVQLSLAIRRATAQHPAADRVRARASRVPRHAPRPTRSADRGAADARAVAGSPPRSLSSDRGAGPPLPETAGAPRGLGVAARGTLRA